MTARKDDERYARMYRVGVQAFRNGAKWLGSHSQPCVKQSCKRPACEGYRDAARHDSGQGRARP